MYESLPYHLLRIQKELKKFDPKLYVKQGELGKVLVMREFNHWVDYHYNEDIHFLYSKKDYHLVFPLTHNWSMRGTPVPWGLDQIRNRLHEIDGWKRDIVQEMKDHNEKNRRSKDRDFRNNTEAFLSDQHSAIKKAWSDINTSTVNKIDNRRKFDKRIKEN